MSLFAGLESIVKENVPLSQYTWFQLGGPARYFVEPTSKEQLLEVIKRCQDNGLRIYVLGNGSNLLVADKGVDGVVIRLSNENFSRISTDGNKVTVGGGARLSGLLRECARNGLGGLECIAGIPGTVGGAVRINAGGRFGDIGSICESVKLMDSSGYEFQWQRTDIFFGYRMTNIMAKFILEADFHLIPDDPENIGKMIKEVWMLKKTSQPMDAPNAGCIFKNPRAMSAGAIIDKAGLKGTRIGGAYISDRHANFILAEKGTVSQDVFDLIELIREKMRERFDVDLELELEIWD